MNTKQVQLSMRHVELHGHPGLSGHMLRPPQASWTERTDWSPGHRGPIVMLRRPGCRGQSAALGPPAYTGHTHLRRPGRRGWWGGCTPGCGAVAAGSKRCSVPLPGSAAGIGSGPGPAPPRGPVGPPPPRHSWQRTPPHCHRNGPDGKKTKRVYSCWSTAGLLQIQVRARWIRHSNLKTSLTNITPCSSVGSVGATYAEATVQCNQAWEALCCISFPLSASSCPDSLNYIIN